MDASFWGYIASFIIGAGVPTLNGRWQRKHDLKKQELQHDYDLRKQELEHEYDQKKQQLEHDFSERKQALEREDRFRLAALDKRLEAQQKAFEYWSKLRPLANQRIELKSELLQEAWGFWSSNCLYLEEDTRKGFNDFLYYVDNYPDIRDYARTTFSDYDEKQRAKKDKMDAWQQMRSFGAIILNDISLKPIDPRMRETQNADGEAIQ